MLNYFRNINRRFLQGLCQSANVPVIELLSEDQGNGKKETWNRSYREDALTF